MILLVRSLLGLLLVPPPAFAASGSLDADVLLRVKAPASEVVEGELVLRAARGDALPDEVTFSLRDGAFARLEEDFLLAPPAASAEGAPLEVTPAGPRRWRVCSGGASGLRLRWAVRLAHRRHPEVARKNDQYEFPYLAADHGLLATAEILPLPESELRSAAVRFELTAGWRVLAPWPEPEPGRFVPPSPGALANDLVALGCWSAREVETAGCRITLAAAPGLEPVLARALPLVAPITRREIECFGRPPRERYLFLFGLPLAPGESPPPGTAFLAGSPKTGSMTLAVAGELPSREWNERLGHLVAHEFHHTFAQSAYAVGGEMRFVNEGLTDYVAYRVLAELGIIDEQRFYALLGDKANAWMRSPLAARLSLVEAGADEHFFAAGDAMHLTYDGGLVFGALLDGALRAARPPATIDALLAEWSEPGRFPHGAAPGPEDLDAWVRARLGDEQAARFHALAHRRGEPHLLDELRRSGLGARVELWSQAPPLDARLEGRCVVAVPPGGAAEAFGLRAGDELLAIGDEPIERGAQLVAAWRKARGPELSVVVLRAGEPRLLTLRLERERRIVIEDAAAVLGRAAAARAPLPR